MGVLGCGTALALALTANTPTGIVTFDTAISAATPVPGTAGLTPGGPAQQVTMTTLPMSDGTITPLGPGNRGLTVIGVALDPSGFPAECPAAVWLPAARLPAARLPGLPATSPSASGLPLTGVRLAVALTGDAPASCQGLRVRLRGAVTLLEAVTASRPGGGRIRVEITGSVLIGTLGTPALTVTQRDGRMVAQPVPAAAGRLPSAYTVDAIGPDGLRTTVCELAGLRPCVDTTAPAETRLRYQVTAHLGNRWRRASATVEVSTPPARRTTV